MMRLIFKKYSLLLWIVLLPMMLIAQSKVNKQNYFPESNNKNVGIDTFVNHWYSNQLRALKEPNLYSIRSSYEKYRFTWLRTFHHPVVVRIENQNGLYTIYWKMSSGAGGYSPGKLIVDKKKSLSKAEWETFMKKIQGINFFKLPNREEGISGNDGSQWILESSHGDSYHFTDRWTPEPSTSYYKCCDYLLSLTDLKIVGRDKY
ncbi:hypothetical protein FFF34_000570 [Inquilinus sp. KBS0705]|nr:hypothetical protein FFF34_000570 [Inquilinus sp. KBS0705]